MNLKINFDDEYFLIKCSIYLISFILTIVFFIEQTLHPGCCDANNYVDIANQYAINGIETNIGNLRTYLYPLILSILIKISKLISFSDRILIMLFQYFLYLIACVSLSNSISANQRISESANQRISESANQRISESANQRINCYMLAYLLV